MNTQHRLVLIASLVLILALGACGTQSTTPTSAPGAATTAVATPEPTGTPMPIPTPTPFPPSPPAPTSTPVALSFIEQPTQILVGGRAQGAPGTADTDHGIYSINTDGTNFHRLDPEGVVDAYPAWSPDGQQITFTRIVTSTIGGEWNNSVIVVMNADGTNERVLTSSEESAVNSVWSPDGSQIAFERFTQPLVPDEMPDAVVSVMNADGTNLHDVGDVGYLIGTPSWSPDGSQIVFAGSTGTEPTPDQPVPFYIYVVQADGSNLHAIAGPGAVMSPRWSPDGSKISFQKVNETVNQPDLETVPPPMIDVWVVNSDGSNPQALTSDQFRMAFFPAWSPDSAQIAFVGVQNPAVGVQGRGDTGIYVANTDGSNLRQLSVDPEAMPLAPSWSPGGGGIAYLAVPTTPGTFDSDLVGAELRLVAADGSEQGTILTNIFVAPVFDPFDSPGSMAPAWRPVTP